MSRLAAYGYDLGYRFFIPQNATPLSKTDIDHLRGDLEGLYYGKCRDVVDRILKKLGSPYDLTTVFNNINQFDREVFAGVPSASIVPTMGWVKSGLRTGLNLSANYAILPYEFSRTMSGRALIHELVHSATDAMTGSNLLSNGPAARDEGYGCDENC